MTIDMGGMDMRVMTEEQYRSRIDRQMRRGRRQALRWAVIATVIVGLMGLGLGTVAARSAEPPVAGGGRVQPKTVPARALFRSEIRRMTGHATPGLFENCMGSTCAVFTRGLGTEATFRRIAGVWRLRTIIVPDVTATQ